MAMQLVDIDAIDIDAIDLDAIDIDADRFELVYRRYAPALLAFCAGRLGNQTDAEDACQEAMFKAQRALPRFRPGASMWPWLATIAANVCIDMQRLRRCDSLDAIAATTAAPDADPHDELTARLRHQVVGDAIGGLPDRYRAPVYLADIEGWTYAEIAELDGSSVDSVRGLLSRGRSLLRVRIAELLRDRHVPALPVAVPLAWARLRARWRAGTNGGQWGAEFAALLAPSLSSVAAGLAAALVTIAAAVLPMTATVLPADSGRLHQTIDASAHAAATTADAAVDGAGGGSSRVVWAGASMANPLTRGKPLATGTVYQDDDIRGADSERTVVLPTGGEVHHGDTEINVQCEGSISAAAACRALDAIFGEPSP